MRSRVSSAAARSTASASAKGTGTESTLFCGPLSLDIKISLCA